MRAAKGLAALLALVCLTGCGVVTVPQKQEAEPVVKAVAETVVQSVTEPELEPVADEPTPDKEKSSDEIYDRLLAGLQAHEESITGLGTDTSAVLELARTVWTDHPELFWYLGSGTAMTTTYGDAVFSVAFEPDYAYTADECASIQAELDAVCAQLHAELDGAGDYEIVKRIYEYVIETVDYSNDLLDQDIVASLVEHRGVCGAYARAVQYLLQSFDIPCRYVRGTTARGSHAWNLAQIGGDWYHVDATWGDPSYEGSTADYGVSYNYLCLTDEQILRTRTIEDGQDLPACTATEWNYFRVSGTYLEDYSYDAYAAICADAVDAGAQSFSVMFGSEAAYNAALDDLITNGRLFEALSGSRNGAGLSEAMSLHYSRDEDLYILTVLPADQSNEENET